MVSYGVLTMGYKIGDKVLFKVRDVLPKYYGSVYEVVGWNWRRDCIVLKDLKNSNSELRFVTEDSICLASFDELLTIIQ